MAERDVRKIVIGVLISAALALIALMWPSAPLDAEWTRDVRPVSARLTLVLLRPDGICGDLSGDGSVDVVDVIIQLRSVVGLHSPDPVQSYLGDLSGSGKIEVVDAVFVLQHIVGMRSFLEVCGPA